MTVWQRAKDCLSRLSDGQLAARGTRGEEAAGACERKCPATHMTKGHCAENSGQDLGMTRETRARGGTKRRTESLEHAFRFLSCLSFILNFTGKQARDFGNKEPLFEGKSTGFYCFLETNAPCSSDTNVIFCITTSKPADCIEDKEVISGSPSNQSMWGMARLPSWRPADAVDGQMGPAALPRQHSSLRVFPDRGSPPLQLSLGEPAHVSGRHFPTPYDNARLQWKKQRVFACGGSSWIGWELTSQS
ncbi:hypothetical protein AAFF_G00258450 [Aldrovandia affinis]|uniref:Uncharacterized protein n=1 Tax=Aldrovandia affinis TaxID=143900 RepID=A0AAD7WT35_9TELE|nr:hypothetical protein AAFF_G00258450 [Aldrovandia affinis]